MSRVEIHGTASDAFQTEVAVRLRSINVALATADEVADVIIRLDAAESLSVGALGYHYRAIVTIHTTVDEIVEDICRCVLHHDPTFISTRGSTTDSSGTQAAQFLSVLRDGLALDGGLFLPRVLRSLASSQLRYIAEQPKLTYHDVAQIVLERLIDTSQLPPSVLRSYIDQAYSPSRWATAEVCPLTPLDLDAANNVHVLELFHGPTAAFKDFALQLFPAMFSSATQNEANKYMILAATSGDTGVAAIVGFLNAAPDSKVMVLYPNHGVSPVQRIQMQSTDDDKHVRVYGVDGDFDFCQNTVKQIFRNESLATELSDNTHTTLSSANSINYGRLIPQVVYYFWAYRKLLEQRHVSVYGSPFDVCVPSGNFGNLLSCFVAKRMGLPVRKLVLASNVNDVLWDFITTGVYDISHRTLQPTASPSIDILKASNIERLLYFLLDGDTEIVARLMHELDETNRFTLPPATFALVKETFWAMRCTEEECSSITRDVFDASSKQRIMDPHTAVGAFAVRRFREAFPGDTHIPMVLASTAHWAKFPFPVLRTLAPQHELLSKIDGDRATPNDVRQLFNTIEEICPAQPTHFALDAAVTKAQHATDNANRTAPRDVTHIINELKSFAAV